MNASDPKAYTIQGVDSMSPPIANPLPLASVADTKRLTSTLMADDCRPMGGWFC